MNKLFFSGVFALCLTYQVASASEFFSDIAIEQAEGITNVENEQK